jgi:hypothetical protein
MRTHTGHERVDLNRAARASNCARSNVAAPLPRPIPARVAVTHAWRAGLRSGAAALTAFLPGES